ncbi:MULTISPECIES: hypothetical protein [Kitasatospora]|uniref:Uncharacterized protein n=1 Tax=Kitasatospora cystarginea TaxID=58350 RepID=A0ABN3EZI7_9ACTN
MVGLLTDDRFGLPLVVEERSCRCPHASEWTRCRVVLRSRLGDQVEVELRFNH